MERNGTNSCDPQLWAPVSHSCQFEHCLINDNHFLAHHQILLIWQHLAEVVCIFTSQNQILNESRCSLSGTIYVVHHLLFIFPQAPLSVIQTNNASQSGKITNFSLQIDGKLSYLVSRSWRREALSLYRSSLFTQADLGGFEGKHSVGKRCLRCPVRCSLRAQGTEQRLSARVCAGEKAPFRLRESSSSLQTTERQARLSAQRECAATQTDTRWRCCTPNPG